MRSDAVKADRSTGVALGVDTMPPHLRPEDPASPARGRSPLPSLLYGLAAVLIVIATIPTRADPDLWGNVRFGTDVLASWRISTADVYSFTQDIPWFNHEWLAQVLMATAYQLAGSPGLVVLKMALVLPTLWLVRTAFHGTRPLFTGGAVLLVFAGALPIVVTVRAQLWSLLGLAVLLRLLDASRARLVWWVPALFVVWVNSHVGWIVGFAVLTWWAAGTAVRRPQERARAVAVLATSLIATLANPHGWQLWQFTAGATHLSRNLTEWQPLWSTPVYNWAPWACAVALTIAACLRAPRIPLERAICVAVLGAVSAQVVKFVPLFVELAVFSLAPVARAWWPRAAARPALAPAIRWVNYAAIGAFAAVALVASWPRVRCLPADDWRPDATAARALIDARASGRIAVWFDWGEYVIWHRGPALRVSFDPRYDLVYSAATIDEQEQVARATPAGIAFLERTRPEYVWYPAEMTALKQWVATHGYRVDVATDESFLAVRGDLPPVRQPPPQTFGCFPAP